MGILNVQYSNGSVEKARIFDAQGRMLLETDFELNTDARIQNEFYSIGNFSRNYNKTGYQKIIALTK